ncbi:MAG: pseudouridine synthase [Flavihumibacter sp.]
MFSYYIIYKPYQVLCQFSASPGKRTLKDIVTVENDVYPVGRLDYDSEGLLLLTNDTSMNKLLLSPVKPHTRTYYVQVEGIPTPADFDQWKKGIDISIDGKIHHTKRANAWPLLSEPLLPERHPPIRFRQSIPVSWMALELTEGKNRQVRRMTAALGYPTLRLVRYAIGQLNISGWQPGECRKCGRADLIRYLA